MVLFSNPKSGLPLWEGHIDVPRAAEPWRECQTDVPRVAERSTVTYSLHFD